MAGAPAQRDRARAGVGAPCDRRGRRRAVGDGPRSDRAHALGAPGSGLRGRPLRLGVFALAQTAFALFFVALVAATRAAGALWPSPRARRRTRRASAAPRDRLADCSE